MSLTGAASNGFGQEPMSVVDIVKLAANYEYSDDIALKYWLRTADAIQKQAQSYDRDGNEQDAYLFYMRYVLLVLERLQIHPQAKEHANKLALKKTKLDVQKSLERLEGLKPRITERYEAHQKDVARRRAEREKWAKDHSGASLIKDLDHVSLSRRTSISEPRRRRKEIHTGKGQNEALALSLAHKEFKKRKTARLDDFEDGQEDEIDDLAKLVVQAGKRGDDTLVERNGNISNEGKTFTPRNYNYPTVPLKKDYDWRDPPTRPTHSNDSWQDISSSQRSNAPQRPPKERLAPSQPPLPPKVHSLPNPMSPIPPPRPDKVFTPDVSELPTRSSTGTPYPSAKDYTFVPSAFTESGAPLRTVFINPDLRSHFLRIAQPNTTRNLETCGILCGTLISNAFFISKLVIPEQKATSDTCDTENESALFDYVDTHDLMTLGWIHTHPSQSCFMSSRDLHTHGGYQVQLAESIAIVCAPSKNPDYGVFRLTDPPGLKAILRCQKTGLFHPHEEGSIYSDAMKPGHVWELDGLEFEVVDLRPKN